MTDDLERRLRTSLSGAALPSAPDSLHEALDRLPDDAGPIGTGGQNRRLAWAMPVLVVVVVLALIAAWLPGGILGPAGPTASPRGSPSAVPSTGPDITWTEATSIGNDLINSVVALPGGGYLGVGSVYDAQGVLWFSSDGRTWQRTLATDPALADSLFDQVVLMPHGGLLLVGEAAALDGQCGGGALGCNPVNQLRMWISSDGRTWQDLPTSSLAPFGRAESVQVVVGPAGLVASGVVAPVTGELTSSIWTSPDGTTWTQATQFHQAFPNAVIDAIVATRTGFAITGQLDVNTIPSGTDGAAWFSVDGLTWWQAVMPADSPIVGNLVTVPGGALGVAIGPDNGALSIWHTTDGSSWQIEPPSSVPFGPGVNLPRFLSDGARVVELSAARAWTSTDVSSWQELSETDAPPLDGFHAGLLTATGLIIVVDSDIWFGAWPEPAASPGPTSLGASAMPSPSTSAARLQVTLPLGSGHSMVVTVSDESGQLRGIRAATSAELIDRPIPEDTLVYNSGGRPSSQVRLVWGGVICDTAATLVIGPDARTWTLTDGPHPPCDTSNDARGVVLTFGQSIDAASIALTHHRGQILWPEVTEYGVIDANTGWSVEDGRLETTHDGGASWSLKAPLSWPALGSGDIGFTDASHGWGLNLASPSQPLFERTADGGANWSAAALSPLGTPSVPYFFDPLDGYLLISSSPAGKTGTLIRTRDGGATWSQVATVPSGILGPIEFSDAADGYAVGTTQPIAPIVPNRDALFATHDGGQTWSQVTIPVPAGFGAVTSADVTRLPVITGPDSAVALVGLTSTSQSATEALVTSDAGRTWTISASLPADESAMPFAAFPTGRWVAVFALDGSSTPSLVESLDGGRTWSPIRAIGIPTNGVIRSFAWVDPTHGWALVDTVSDATPPEQMPGQLLSTSDGGSSWGGITPYQ